MKKATITKKINDIGAFAVVRVDEYERAMEITQACINGGIPAMELSYTSNNAGGFIKRLREDFGDDLCLGAGTVLDSETARDAILNGAEFIIAPTFSKEVAKMCNRYQIPYAPGCTSYCEAVEALEYGAAFIKAFPISDFYGSKLVSVFKTPFPDMPILASGGISLENIGQWIENGVDVCGMGSLLTRDSKPQIEQNAKELRTVIDEAREIYTEISTK